MFDHICGNITELTPTYVVIRAGGVGYFIHISLHTYSLIQANQKDESDRDDFSLFLHHIVREDAQLLYGFYEREEREMFRLLISVSGVGANTSRMILSSIAPDTLIETIASGNSTALKSIKGIGAKSAERIIIDLKDKVAVAKTHPGMTFASTGSSAVQEEALSALTTLGFNKVSAQKVIEKILSEDTQISVEQLIKESLKRL